MLTIKQITDNTDAVIRGLEKKHFKTPKKPLSKCWKPTTNDATPKQS